MKREMSEFREKKRLLCNSLERLRHLENKANRGSFSETINSLRSQQLLGKIRDMDSSELREAIKEVTISIFGCAVVSQRKSSPGVVL